MKKSLLLRRGIVLSLVTFIVFQSCKKDELNSKEMLVFLTGDVAGSGTNTKTVPFVHNPLSIDGNTSIDVSAYASREVAADVNVSIYPDNRFVGGYNQKNGTACLELPAAAYQVVNGSAHKIPKDSLMSDPIQIKITHPEMLTNPAGYLLPLTITAVDSKDKGVKVSTTHATMYIRITYEFNNIVQNQVPLTGTAMSRTAWSVTVSNTTSGALGPAMLDGVNTTSWRSSNSTSAVKWAVINMGSAQLVKGFQIVPNYVSLTENATRMSVSTSIDNVTFTPQGTWNGTGPVTGSTAASPDIKGVNFISPVTARYFRFDITALVSGGRVGFAEINAIQ